MLKMKCSQSVHIKYNHIGVECFNIDKSPHTFKFEYGRHFDDNNAVVFFFGGGEFLFRLGPAISSVCSRSGKCWTIYPTHQ